LATGSFAVLTAVKIRHRTILKKWASWGVRTFMGYPTVVDRLTG